MAWNYSGDPSASKLDGVRFLVRDTDIADPILQDAEVNFSLSQNGNNLYRAAAAICDGIALELGRELTFEGDIAWSSKEKYEQYKQMAAEYRIQASKSGGAVFAGGISVADKSSRAQDSDRAPNDFTRDTGKNPDTIVNPSETWRDWP